MDFRPLYGGSMEGYPNSNSVVKPEPVFFGFTLNFQGKKTSSTSSVRKRGRKDVEKKISPRTAAEIFRPKARAGP